MAKRTTPPRSFTQGDTVTWTESLSDFKASLYTLTYRFVSKDGIFDATITANGEDFDVVIAKADTEDMVDGEFEWQKRVTKISDSTVQTLCTGRSRVLKNYATISDGEAYDPRSFAEKTLANIRVVLEGKATRDQSSYSVNGRSLSRYSYDELLTAERDFAARVRMERNAAVRRRGGKSRRTVMAMFPSSH